MDQQLKKPSAAGMLIALGIVFGDIGTSPLYVFQSLLVDGGKVNESLVLGSISCIFWTLTLQTTFKYVVITLQADNHGEGGIFALYALVKPYGKWLAIPAIVGAGTLLADGIITPPISITSAIEGLKMVNGLSHTIVPGNGLVLLIVIVILLLLFFFQRFGTGVVGSAFGPVMFLWFLMLGTLGLLQFVQHPEIIKAFNPYYGARLLIEHPKGFWLLGAVFLCTTGAEALYSDLGHCGKRNIQVSWIFVKITLLLNYLGQGAWVLMQQPGKNFNEVNPFFEIVPHFFLIPGIAVATLATIIASQALISGSFTLINEAIRMNFWPHVKVKYPSNIRGQIYIPGINWIICLGCIAVTLYFRTSTAMTAAYGFSITVAMLMTTTLMYYFMRYVKKWPLWLVMPIVVLFVCVEVSFFVANAVKLLKRLFFLVFEFGLIFTMYIWHKARMINDRLVCFVNLKDQIPFLLDLNADQSVPKYATHLIYFTKADDAQQIEQSIMFSILSRKPKRADMYWFIHMELADDPYTMEYAVEELAISKVVRIVFRLGFRVQPRVNILFRKVVEDLVKNKELDVVSPYLSLKKRGMHADFQFVIMQKFLSHDNELRVGEEFILNSYFFLRKLELTEKEAFGLDTSDTVIEKLPFLVKSVKDLGLKRVDIKSSRKNK
ncbi:KUP system potassium uptake protein [Mucilaginibacter lappiensis]|uniref:Probable potassium transport system protein Kup n=1 Tax=Mucilaginibacter lappiensis TaxID=354630 RepID=A0ABR6PGB2_9SPHI|nr:KUP/HAK/KT family potassium transporter [Mucilaginibacter lappiensis]MBB6108643.1 KUP system potassium uptake protein [Mucilaginibacter lappiensis]SIQ29629.1 KUP system potassium uptake protein [Mucilaginibacter lappiensis]